MLHLVIGSLNVVELLFFIKGDDSFNPYFCKCYPDHKARNFFEIVAKK